MTSAPGGFDGGRPVEVGAGPLGALVPACGRGGSSFYLDGTTPIDTGASSPGGSGPLAPGGRGWVRSL